MAAMVAAAIVTVAFGGGGDASPDVLVEWLQDRVPHDTRGHLDDDPTPTLVGSGIVTARPTSTPSPAAGLPAGASGLDIPVAGGCLPSSDALMPGAPREYRDGVHEGVDFYESDNCVPLGLDTEILSAKAGTVIRADRSYVDLTLEELAGLEARVAAGEGNDPEILDAFRGRQVWIDHGNGVVTRYAHLNAIADGIAIGAEVSRGDLIAYMGESGSPESATDPGTQIHLHFEIRVGNGYLGEDLAPNAVRRLYERAFGL